MSIQAIREFHLSPAGSKRGISCDSNGVSVCDIPLLKRIAGRDGREVWKPRECDALSDDLSSAFGLPIDISSKAAALSALARDLNKSDLVHAQLIALHMEFPDPQPLPKSAGYSRGNFIKLVQALHASQLLKIDWEPDEHPRWPAGAPDSQGGEFAPKDEAVAGSGILSSDTIPEMRATIANDTSDVGYHHNEGLDQRAPFSDIIPDITHGVEGGQLDEVVYRGDFHDEKVREYAEYLREHGVHVETEVGVAMADRSASTRVDVLAQVGGVTVGVEVKTGDNPFLTLSQMLIYPHMIYGESVVSSDPKILTFGFRRGQLLPPIPVISMYVRDPSSRPVFDFFDPKRMLEEYYRRFGRLKKWDAPAENIAGNGGISLWLK